MLASWTVSDDSIEAWRQLVAANRGKDLPTRRRKLNVQRKGIDLSKEVIWRRLIGCQVTTQQPSGPTSRVKRFLESSSPLLQLREARKATSLQRFVQEELSRAGLRRGNVIGTHLHSTLQRLEGGEWAILIGHLETIRNYPTVHKERTVVRYLCSKDDGREEKRYPGLGQKQSRNFIQWLGLSRYEIPLDSRVLKTLKGLGANFVPNGSALVDEAVYLFVQDLLHMIAARLDIYPCELDACVFASADQDEEGLDN